MGKRMVLWISAVLLVMGFSIPVSAEGESGMINCWLRWDEKPVADCSLEIYPVGEPVPEGYLLNPEFGGGIIAGEDIPSAAFAQWMAEKAGPGVQQSASRSGLVSFPNLDPGLYLIRQGRENPDFYPIEPYLACVSEELLQIDTYPRIYSRTSLPRTAQHGAVYLATLGIVMAAFGMTLMYQKSRTTEK